MTGEEIVVAVREFAEDRGKKFNLDNWYDLEVQRIVNQKRWWWRKKLFTFNLEVGTALYDLTADGSGNADAADFLEMVDLVLRESDGSVSDINREINTRRVQEILAGQSTAGSPSLYIIEPGTTQQIRFDRNADSTKVVAGVYWAAHNPTELGQNIDQQVPLIPPQFHYVVQLRLLARMFMFLFNTGDPRLSAALGDAREAMLELHAFKAPSTQDVTSLIAHKNVHAVQSTRGGHHSGFRRIRS